MSTDDLCSNRCDQQVGAALDKHRGHDDASRAVTYDPSSMPTAVVLHLSLGGLVVFTPKDRMGDPGHS
ncbi:unnamed protein product [Arctogadus glacialis]